MLSVQSLALHLQEGGGEVTAVAFLRNPAVFFGDIFIF